MSAAEQRSVAPVVEDEVLVVRAREGDERAFAALYRRYARYIAGVVHRLMGGGGEVDDVVQDVFVSASLGLDSLKEPQHVRSWLVTIAVRAVNRRLHARSRWRWLGREVAKQMPRISDPGARAEVDELYDVLDRLPPKLRIPWMLARIEGEALAEVAGLCGISLATAKRRIARAEESVTRRLHAR